jgi:hypothetical protein
MSDYDIHSCGYYCDRHACIVAQRNELRDKLLTKEWVGLTDDEKEDMLKGSKNAYDAIERIEAKLKEKNT